MNSYDYESEIAYLNGVAADGTVAATSYHTWNGAIPAGYDTTSNAVKWGSSTPGTGASVTYAFQVASDWSDEEMATWQGALALWSAVANITFTEAPSEATANFVIIRGTGGAFQQFGSQPLHAGLHRHRDPRRTLSRSAVITLVPTLNGRFAHRYTEFSLVLSE